MPTVSLTAVDVAETIGGDEVFEFLVSSTTLGAPDTVVTPNQQFTHPDTSGKVFSFTGHGWKVVNLSLQASAASVIKLYSGSTLRGTFSVPAGATLQVNDMVSSQNNDAFRIETDVAYTNAILQITPYPSK